MGKTHLSGLEIGDPSVGIWSAVVQAQKVVLTALNAGQRLDFPNGGYIGDIRVTDNAGALVVATIAIGTTNHGTQIFTGASVAGTPTAVNKKVAAGQPYIEATAGTVPLTVYVTFIPG